MLTQAYFDRFYDWVVRPIKNQQDLKLLDAIDVANFGERAFSIERLETLHRRYPEGHRLCCLQDTIIGYITLWPMAKQMAEDFCGGKLREKDLLPIDIEQFQEEGGGTQDWYIGGMVIDPAFRRPIKDNPVGLLLAMAMNSWAESGKLSYPARVFTTAYSKEGEALLRRFGFELLRSGLEMPDGDPLYSRTALNKNDLFEVFIKHGIPNIFSV
jgi:hypothetical protein